MINKAIFVLDSEACLLASVTELLLFFFSIYLLLRKMLQLQIPQQNYQTFPRCRLLQAGAAQGMCP